MSRDRDAVRATARFGSLPVAFPGFTGWNAPESSKHRAGLVGRQTDRSGLRRPRHADVVLEQLEALFDR